MTYKGFSNTEFARVSSTTLAHHIRELEDAAKRNFQIGALLEANGRVNYNNSGEGFDWPVLFRHHAIEGNTGETQRNFKRTNQFKVANQEYRGYQVTDSIFKKEFLANRGPEGVVKVFGNMIKRMTASMKQDLGTEYYIDGAATGNEESWHGFDSIFTHAGTVNITDGTQRTTPNAADKVAYPSGTYAGIVMTLGNYAGENESGEIWPSGIADSEYDFWSPVVVNTTSSAFGGSGDTFATQGDETLRYGIIEAQRNASVDGQMANIILARDYYQSFLNLIDDKERIIISSNNDLRALGFKNVVVFDGVEVSWEAGASSSVGYGFNYECMELKSMEDTLLKSEGPEYDIDSQSHNAVVYTLSNLKYDSPRNFCKWMEHGDMTSG